jgi:hypothetical protein
VKNRRAWKIARREDVSIAEVVRRGLRYILDNDEANGERDDEN